MKTFRVWHLECGETEDEADSVSAFDAEAAAKEWCDRHHADHDYTASFEGVMVREAGGVLRCFDVSVEAVPHFSAHERPVTERKADQT